MAEIKLWHCTERCLVGTRHKLGYAYLTKDLFSFLKATGKSSGLESQLFKGISKDLEVQVLTFSLDNWDCF